ncbi:MAG TPA: MASE3 domain-containing protein, partial [Methanoregula sp.]|nr:MASE3 domain-containing protein [Methanoregula sp.]
GMGVFYGNDADLPTQLWIAARYFQSITFLVATFFIGRSITKERKYDAAIVLSACTAACVLLFLSLFVWHNFPPCFVEGSGLTPFKILSEYVISLILIATIVILYKKREHFEPDVFWYLVAAQVFLILGELAFTSYVDVYGFMNMLGHLFRLVSIYLFYRAFVVVSLKQPYDHLREAYERLTASEEEIRANYEELARTRDALAESERKYRDLYRYAQVALFETSFRDGTIHACNKRYADLAGFDSVEEATGSDILPLYVNPEDRAEVGRILREQGHIENRVIRLRNRRTQEEFWGQFSARFDYEREVAEGTIIDITERLRTEEALRESESRLRSFIETTQDAITIIEEEGKIIEWNRGSEQISGIPRQEALGKNMWDITYQLIPPERRSESLRAVLEQKIRASLETGVPIFSEPSVVEAMRADGTRFFSRQAIFSIKTDRGYRFGSLAQDITREKQAEETLRETTRKLIEAQELAHLGFWSWNVTTGEVEWSDEVFRIFGLDPRSFKPT